MRIFGILRTFSNIQPVNFYRTFSPLKTMSMHLPVEVSLIDQWSAQQSMRGQRTGTETIGYDIYTTCRMYNEDSEPFLEMVRDGGGLFVFDSDDDLTERYRMVSGRGEVFRKMLADADYVTTSTPELAKLFSEWSRHPPVVLPNHINVESFAKVADEARRVYAEITVGFSGTRTHWGDWYIPSVPLARIVDERSNVIPLLHGDPPEYLGFMKADIRKNCPYSEYPAVLKQFDVLLCGIDTKDGFSRGKSGVKALEAMVAGAVPICSNSTSYRRLYERGAPIVIVPEESRDGWYEAIRDIVTDDEKRRYLKSFGRSWVAEHRNMDTGCKRWYDAYQEMMSDS